MKKGLSVLLIAAALFGFYGGATSLTDVLASKDYWEEEGERSTADMNKLEDGLNQLKDNEQAYLDGQKQLADGEKKLAEGEAQYAQGLADYAAAPAKLAQGERDLAAGKAELAQGYADYAEAPANLDALSASIENLKLARTSFNDYSTDPDTGERGPSWKQGFEKKASKPDYSDAGLRQARSVITTTVNSKSGTLDTAANLGGMKGSLSDKILKAKTYAQFDDALSSGIKPLAEAAKKLDQLSSAVSSAVSSKQKEFSEAAILIGDPNARQAKIDELEGQRNLLLSLRDALEQYVRPQGDNTPVPSSIGGVTVPEDLVGKPVGTVDDQIIPYMISQIEAAQDKLKDTLNLKKDVAKGINDAINSMGGSGSLEMVKSLDEDLYNSLTKDLGILTLKVQSTDAVYAATIGQFEADMATLATALKAASDEAQSTSNTFATWHAGYEKLKSGKDTLASGLSSGFAAALANNKIRPVLDDKAPTLVALMLKYSGSRLDNDDLDDFDEDMKEVADTIIPNLIQILGGIKAQGLADYAAAPGKLADGERRLAAGKAELAQGYADYAAAPAKLAEAEKQLADGRKQLADGKKKLAEYEDGEQQVRDGLATLMATKADPGLESILDRRNGDDKFDDAKGHLQLDEGLEAVDIGRGYQADSGELITKEVTNRAIGTAAGLGAAALAVLAAVLSFLKKNKGAAVSAVLAAVAGGIGAGVGFGAGEYYSDIAGSTVGNTPFIAAAVLAAVAVVFAIAHFTAQPEAKPEAK